MDKPNALGITADEFKAIEQTRQRLFQLSNSIQGLRMDVLKSNPLPPPASLQAQSQILLRNLQSLLETLTENTHVFQHLHVFPDVAYPGRVHENILLQLLRKKLEPGVEEWVERGRETTRELRGGANAAPPPSLSDGSSVGIGGGPGIAGGPVGAGNGGGEAQLEAVWRDVRAWTVERVQKYVLEEAGDVYTEDERRMGVENVRTGLRRGLEEDDEDDDDEDEESDEEGGGGGDGDVIMSGQSQKTKKPTKPTGPEPEMLFWFEARGDFDLPRNVDLLSQAGMKRGR
ncbi:RNA polymerase II mediator complex component Med8 [Colletotrichum lupini]|uniref:Mediator of RNA polymerase II transcription subunit 8 n=2 Tax=Colletotrichum acutatum species complex TaxID=2707335 RepID=A0A9Q8T319_9PEZI|nr:RNA polymerase II mediator complex component Med8 [Colletotrichum lupini]XP_060314879.1 RNA polymerase II mediator complex component Med8 [Colletotrichum costaricense]KAK1529178.1 RNA polymerase II mediator complex component Med8 [Colletotrichum costaricense]KAK1716596.1 mediator of RNA polymerase II transcription complex subunit 8-domain-containing protein [Colletotrichum lupini]UQC88394.1 RNA polymerase II mediator complex component Med8 [Colletotrichum lupini]